MDSENIAAIARSLSKAQRDCLLAKRGEKSDFFALTRAGLATYEPIYHSIPGMRGRCRIGYEADFTTKGLAVRQHLLAAAGENV